MLRLVDPDGHAHAGVRRQWQRETVATARLAFGRAEPAPMLDSMFRDEADAKQRKLHDMRAYLGSINGSGNAVMITHDVNIQALVGRS